VTTVRFSLDGQDYEIDLSLSHVAAMKKELAKFIAHARKVTGKSKPKSKYPVKDTDRAKLRAWSIRARKWAREQQFNVSDRGYIPREIARAYEAATGDVKPVFN
jgi:hypothetical protein